MLRALALLALCLMAPCASAGPWPRAQGETFLSATYETGGPDDYASLYAEYGLSKRLTLGLDLGATPDTAKKTIAFARWPVGGTDRPLRMAVQLGLGYAERWRTPPFKLVITGGGPLPPLPGPRPKMRPVLQTGVSLGRGLGILGHNGWITLDTRAETDDALATQYEADATVGLKTRKGHMFIMQLQTGATDTGQTWAKLAPAYVRQLSNTTHLEVGVTAGLMEGNDLAARFGLWQEF
ncbi:hypothetical protein FDP25_02255 [Roseovarius sp. A21]|uniref:Cellulose biosynthesis protein BcsS n=1 Tax=Roseovarius bejariae TaxID=2576383 RepID=A0A844CX90_9RHOB|nr:hypothetical protein [Roseovarius bejariae]MRU14243.1 hypothetical protein [Roseovarius bejariae]